MYYQVNVRACNTTRENSSLYYLRHSGFPNVIDPCTSVPSCITHQQKPLVLLHCAGWKKPFPSQIGTLTLFLGGNFKTNDFSISHGPSSTVLNALATIYVKHIKKY